MASDEKEKEEKLKALRRELEEKIEEQLPPEMLENPPRVEVQSVSGAEELEPEKAKQVIEALLFAATKPITVAEIRKVIKTLTPTLIVGHIQQLKLDYEQGNRSFEIVEVANGYEVATKKEFAPWIMRVELQKKARQVTLSALETLAILAYKQPITRVEIEELRGVDASGVLNTLMERDLIKIVGRKEVPGRPFMYGTTDKFLEHFGLKSLAELPSIEEIRKLVENSVRKEDLIGRPQVVEVPPSEGASDAGETAQETLVEEIQTESQAQEENKSQEPQDSPENVFREDAAVTQDEEPAIHQDGENHESSEHSQKN